MSESVKEEFYLDESHGKWSPEIDNHAVVEAYRRQTGELPPQPNDNREDDSVEVIKEFLRNDELHMELMSEDAQMFGTLYLSSKRFIYRHCVEDE